jgi:hypothetical protein
MGNSGAEWGMQRGPDDAAGGRRGMTFLNIRFSAQASLRPHLVGRVMTPSS